MNKYVLEWGGSLRVAASTANMARRMLCVSETMTGMLPKGIGSSSGLNILLLLHAAEEEAGYLSISDIVPAGKPSDGATRRWVVYLVQCGLVEQRGDMLALSDEGHTAITNALKAALAAQRTLD